VIAQQRQFLIDQGPDRPLRSGITKLDADGVVSSSDLTALLAAWG